MTTPIEIETLEEAIENERQFYEKSSFHTPVDAKEYDGYKTLQAAQSYLDLIAGKHETHSMVENGKLKFMAANCEKWLVHREEQEAQEEIQ